MHHKTIASPTNSLHTQPQDQHQEHETKQPQNTDTNNSTAARTNIAYDPQLFTSQTPSLPLASAEAVDSNQKFSINLSTAVEMSMQLDTEPNFMSNTQMIPAATAEEGAGLAQLEGTIASHQSLRVKDDIPIDLRVKLIVSMIYLNAIPSEV